MPVKKAIIPTKKNRMPTHTGGAFFFRFSICSVTVIALPTMPNARAKPTGAAGELKPNRKSPAAPGRP